MLNATSSTTQLLTFTRLVIEVRFLHSSSIVHFRPGNFQLAARRTSEKHRSTPQFAGPYWQKSLLPPRARVGQTFAHDLARLHLYRGFQPGATSSTRRYV